VIDFDAFRGYVFVLSILDLGVLFGCVRRVRFREWIGHSRGILLLMWCFLVGFLQVSRIPSEARNEERGRGKVEVESQE
jgi:hypothetical protein